MNRIRFFATLTLAFVAAGPLAAQGTLAIKGARILPVSGPPIDNGVIVIKDGKIEAVGKDVAVPTGAKVIDGTGKVVVPGLIEVHSSRGMDQANETNPNVPFLSVVDAIDPIQEYFEDCRRNGVTTVAIMPGNNTMLGGQGAILKAAGGYVSDMVVKKGAGIKISLRPVADRNRMGQIAAIRRELDAARDGLTTGANANQGGEGFGAQATPTSQRGSGPGAAATQEPTQRGRRGGAQRGGAPAGPMAGDEALVRAALQKLLKGELLAYIYCELAMDVPHAIKLVQDYKLKGVLVLAQDCHKAIKEVAASKLPVILDPTLVYWETDPRTGEDRQVVLPKIYREAGVPVMFQIGAAAAAGGGGGGRGGGAAQPTLGTNYLWYQAATAVKYGMSREDALKAITLQPAQTLGVEKQVGSIEPGKDADLVVLTGDPLKLDTWVHTTIVGGKVVYERDNDRKLQKLLKPNDK